MPESKICFHDQMLENSEMQPEKQNKNKKQM